MDQLYINNKNFDSTPENCQKWSIMVPAGLWNEKYVLSWKENVYFYKNFLNHVRTMYNYSKLCYKQLYNTCNTLTKS